MDMLVSTDRLAGELGAHDLALLDASLHLPQARRDARAEFEQAHLPGARFLDLAGLHDPQSSLPGKVPDAARVKDRLEALGVGPQSRVILYDASELRTACRAWFLLEVHGFENVAVLDGGLPKWRSEDRPLVSGEPGSTPSEGIALTPHTHMLRDKDAMLANVASHAEQVVDARDAGRFTGAAPDTVHGLPGGHVPHARNVPFTELLRADGTFLSKTDLRERFERAGIDLSRPVVPMCGSGVTASVLVFALRLVGSDRVALYDGSWAEWGADPATPKETGPEEASPGEAGAAS